MTGPRESTHIEREMTGHEVCGTAEHVRRCAGNNGVEGVYVPERIRRNTCF
jgi:hypothetical protein